MKNKIAKFLILFHGERGVYSACPGLSQRQSAASHWSQALRFRISRASRLLAALVFGGVMWAVASQATMSYLDNGVVRVGVDLTMGGAITYLSQSGTTNNVINSYDLGREVQQSYYSGPSNYTDGHTQNPAYSPWPWNPIQVGDSYNNRSQIVNNSNDGTTIYVKCIPMQWALDNDPGECTFESWITLDGYTVVVTNRLLNARSDHTDYGSRGQELPAVYTIGTLDNLKSYMGNAPYTSGGISGLSEVGPPWFQWLGTESWAAQVNASDWGVGIYTPEAVYFTGGFSGTRGSGGPTSPNTGYMAPVRSEILDHNINYDYTYYLILGTLTQIRDYVYAQPYRPRCDSYFNTDRQHWTYVNTTDSGWPLTNTRVQVKLGTGGEMWSDWSAFRASTVPTLYIRAQYVTSATAGQVYWATNNAGDPVGFNANCSTSFPILGDGQPHTYAVDLAGSSYYTGLITHLRVDPANGGSSGDYVNVTEISSSSSQPTMIANGNFTGNSSLFTGYPGYTGGSNPANITSWTSSVTGTGNVGLNGRHAGSANNPGAFAPTISSGYTFAFIQSASIGTKELYQNLTLSTSTAYQLDFDVAARAGNSASFKVMISDNTQTYVSSGTKTADDGGFVHYRYEFTAPASFNGAPTLELYNMASTTNDQTVDFANVSLVQNGVYNGDFAQNASLFTTSPGYDYSPNPTNITSWTSIITGTGNVGVNGAKAGSANNPGAFAPASSSGYTFAFIQSASANAQELYQNLTLSTSTAYQLDFDVAARAGNSASFKVMISDNTQTYVSSGTKTADNGDFAHYSYIFTAPGSFNGVPTIQLWNMASTTTDQTVDFANISLLVLP